MLAELLNVGSDNVVLRILLHQFFTSFEHFVKFHLTGERNLNKNYVHHSLLDAFL